MHIPYLQDVCSQVEATTYTCNLRHVTKRITETRGGFQETGYHLT